MQRRTRGRYVNIECGMNSIDLAVLVVTDAVHSNHRIVLGPHSLTRAALS
jgi:hypothetical protein